MHKLVPLLYMFRLLTYTYLILVNFKRHFSTLIPHHPPHDDKFLYSLSPHDKFLYSRRYIRSRYDYDDKYLFSRRYIRNRNDYDDQQGREVVVCCEAAVSYLACLFAGLLAYLLTYLLACLLAWFVSWLIGWLDACLLAYLLG